VEDAGVKRADATKRMRIVRKVWDWMMEWNDKSRNR
jgi:hypothetical protein